MAVTIVQIAKKLDISYSTVSRVLNNRGHDFISQKTRDRVLAASREMGYRPNLTARALATGRTKTIAVWSSSLNEPYYWQLLNALEDEVTSHDFRLLVRRSRDPHQDLLTALETVDVDGVIVIDAFPAIRRSLPIPPGLGAPCVFIGVYAPEFSDFVRVDLSRGLTQALTMMIDSGRKRIAYLVTKDNDWMASEEDVRYRVYSRMLQSAGRELELIRFPLADCSTAGPVLENYIESHGCPEGLLCQNDLAAMSAYRSLRDLNLRIPDDIAVVGCDGTHEMQYFDPPLSTVAQPTRRMCALAWKFLHNRMQDPSLSIQQETVLGELIVRRSLTAG